MYHPPQGLLRIRSLRSSRSGKDAVQEYVSLTTYPDEVVE